MRQVFLILLFSLFAFTVQAQSPARTSSHGWLLVANKGDNALGIIDPRTEKQIAEIPEGGVTGHEIATSRDGNWLTCPSTEIPESDNREPMAAIWW